ncbi:SH3 and PX domain-containing protein 2B-like [Orbicella faveolata]|uniref:SH3 and PX domain-containing protein 2B-like n=1 Tax=Orbicella faveolata TaxID=48498 RepID=UPI0009E5DCD1|nr:SH3 and PX domain-containing protein 2B-like [Orbicella faveolata]
MLSRSKAQLSPRRSHVCVVSDCIDSVDEKIAMIYVVSAKLDSIKERWVGSKSRKKQYAFVFNLTWSDGSLSVIWRSYNDVFDFQCGLLDSFPEEAGTVRGFVRIIPYLPGRKILRKSDLTLAEERKPEIESYVKKLIKLPPKISQSNIVMSFLKRKQSDPEWFQQFPQGINRQGDHVDISDSKDSMTENTVKEGQQVLQGADLLYEDDSGQGSYLNPTFEASEV